MSSTLLYHLTSVMEVLLSDVTAPVLNPFMKNIDYWVNLFLQLFCFGTTGFLFSFHIIMDISWISGVIAVWCICGTLFDSVVSIYWCSLFTLRIMSPLVDELLTKTQRDPFTLIRVTYNAPDTKLVFSGRGSYVTYHIYAGIVTLTGVPPQTWWAGASISPCQAEVPTCPTPVDLSRIICDTSSSLQL